jgi:MFS family permease
MEQITLGGGFWRFWGATFLANIGDGIRLAAFPLLAASLTDEPLAVAAVAAAQLLPWLVFGLVAGSWADRFPSRRLLVAADALRAAVLLVLVVGIAVGWAGIGVVVVAAVALGVGETVRDTAAQSTIPRLVAKPLLERANSRLVAGEIVGNEFVGPPVGAALFAVGAALPFAVNGGALALAVMLLLSVPLSAGLAGPRPATHEDHERVAEGVRAGLVWLVRHRVLRALTGVGALVAAADAAWFSIFVLFVRDRLDLGVVSFGWLLASGALGGLAGAWAAERLLVRPGAVTRHREVLTGSILLTAGVPLLLLAAPDLWSAVTVTMVTSAGFALFNVAALSLRHRSVPEGLVGRVTAAARVVTFGAAALGTLLGGWLAGAVGLGTPFLLSGLLAVVAVVWWWTATRPGASPAPA